MAAVAAEELVTRIFREVVERGNEAVTQAEDVADEDEEVGWGMLKAGQALVKEGERATKRLRTLLDKHDAEFSDAIKQLMVHNEDILEKQRALDSMLYDFDDYMEIDSFDPERFTELQSATKGLALLLMESIRKTVAEPVVAPVPKPVTHETLPPPAPRPTAFPPLPPLPPNAPTMRPESRSSKHSSIMSNARPSTQGRERPPTLSQWPRPPGAKLARSRSGSAGHNGLPSPTSTTHEYRPTALRPPPSPQPAQRLSDGDSTKFDFGLHTRLPQLSHRSSHTDLIREDMDRMRLADTLRLPADKKYAAAAPLQTSFLEHDSFGESPTTTYNDRRFTTASSDRQSSNFDTTTSPHQSHHSGSNRTSAFSNATSYTSPTRQSTTTFNGGIPRSSSVQKPAELREKHIMNLAEPQSGLMLVEEWQSTHTSTTHDTSTTGYPSWRRVDTSLGVESTFISMKGFCKGAMLFTESGPGECIRKVGGPGAAQLVTDFSSGMGYGGAYSAFNARFQEPMAQCNRCEFTHKYAQLMQDLDKDPVATLTSHGMRYRKRFLYKSHFPTKVMTKAYFGCPFCAHAGSTPREGDATVFTSADAFLRHVARHPQPLPDVPGFIILYGTLPTEDPSANDFDVHFPSPPAAPGGPPEADMSKVTLLPSMTAVKDHVQLPGEKPLERPEKTTTTPVLEFFAGARIVGVEFPQQWNGKWCTGWHDGEFGAFPARWGQLDPPRRGKMASQGAPKTRRSAVTRWKWDARGGAGTAGWLGLDKGETISNLEWDDPDAWYWIGTNKKGKWGIFPSSHIKMDSVKDAALESGSSSMTKSKKSILPW